MRTFFAINIATEIQYAIAQWRERAMLPTASVSRPVVAANFHITLHFLGDIAPRPLERLCAAVDQINASRFELRLNTLGYFPAPGIGWLGSDDIPAELNQLVRALQKVGRSIGVKTPRKTFVPHLTLFRNCRARPALPISAPDFDITCDGFALFESIAGRKGVRYQLVRRWSLK